MSIKVNLHINHYFLNDIQNPKRTSKSEQKMYHVCKSYAFLGLPSGA